MIEEIKKIIKSLEGSVVAFGFKTEKFSSILNSNDKITTFDVLEGIAKKRKNKKGKQKTININSLRKKYKKKKINTILIDVDVMDKYMIYLIKETIYIGKDKLYLFGSKENVEKCLIKYKRYNILSEEKEYNNKLIVKVDISKSKSYKIKDKLYIIKDKIDIFLAMITDILTS